MSPAEGGDIDKGVHLGSMGNISWPLPFSLGVGIVETRLGEWIVEELTQLKKNDTQAPGPTQNRHLHRTLQ